MNDFSSGNSLCSTKYSICSLVNVSRSNNALAINLTKRSRGFKAGEGLVQDNIEKTVYDLSMKKITEEAHSFHQVY